VVETNSIMDFTDKFKNETHAIFDNLSKSHQHLNGRIAEIIDREFRGWSKWFYKIKGQTQWFQEGCLKPYNNP
jgi:hypothetical protein